jgi:hypothetical protein
MNDAGHSGGEDQPVQHPPTAPPSRRMMPAVEAGRTKLERVRHQPAVTAGVPGVRAADCCSSPPFLGTSFPIARNRAETEKHFLQKPTFSNTRASFSVASRLLNSGLMSSQPHVMVVDDDVAMCRFLHSFLSKRDRWTSSSV